MEWITSQAFLSLSFLTGFATHAICYWQGNGVFYPSNELFSFSGGCPRHLPHVFHVLTMCAISGNIWPARPPEARPCSYSQEHYGVGTRSPTNTFLKGTGSVFSITNLGQVPKLLYLVCKTRILLSPVVTGGAHVHTHTHLPSFCIHFSKAV